MINEILKYFNTHYPNMSIPIEFSDEFYPIFSNIDKRDFKQIFQKAVEIHNNQMKQIFLKQLSIEKKIRESEMREKCMLNVIENGDVKSLITMAEYFEYSEKYKKMKKFYKMALKNTEDPGIIQLICRNLGKYYLQEKNVEKMLKWFERAIESGCVDSMLILGEYYSKFPESHDYLKYYCMAYKTGDKRAITLINSYIRGKNSIQIYKFFHKYDIPFVINPDHLLHKYNNKCKFLAKEDKCPVCLETKQCIPLECVHWFCVDCYPDLLNKNYCPICRTKI
jgi:tetratricopeptide (TPR) repeat protein